MKISKDLEGKEIPTYKQEKNKDTWIFILTGLFIIIFFITGSFLVQYYSGLLFKTEISILQASILILLLRYIFS